MKSFFEIIPRTDKVSTIRGVIDIDKFDLRQTAQLITIRADLEREYWKAIIRNDKILIAQIDDERKKIDTRIQTWAATKSNKA